MADLTSLTVALFVVASIAVLALYTVGRQEREIRKLKRELKGRE